MANLKNTVISDAQFRLPVGDTAARPGSPNARQIRFNTETGKLEQFRPSVGDWIAPNNSGVIATGGDSVYDVDVEGTTYRVHVFTSTGTSTFSVLQGGEAEYLIIAGGGGGGDHRNKTGTGTAGGGGGGGGVLTGSLVITQSNYNVSVGNGGINPDGQTGVNGDDSSVFSFTAVGGGGGGARNSAANSGGSGGGVGYADNSGGSGTAGQGNKGGDSNNNTYAGTGGGGAGEPGVGFPSPTGATGTGTRGGNGINIGITGINNFYAGGGGGGDAEDAGTSQGASGGLGGGGAGSGAGDLSVGPNNAQSGIENTGGGGGGAASDNTLGGDGGSGIVVIRYPLRQENPVTAPGRDVQDGLILDLDFAKPTVYAGSGSVVTDSRLNGIEGDLINGPTYINSRTHRSAFEFNGSNQQISGNLNNSLNAPFTLEFFGKFNTITQNDYEYFGSVGNSGTNSMISVSKVGTRDSNSNRHGYMYIFPGSGSALYTDIDLRTTDYQHITLVCIKNAPYVLVYKNGIQGILESPVTGAINTNGNFRVATWSNSTWWLNGNIGYMKVYNRAFTAAEIQQNFEATRWRFGV